MNEDYTTQYLEEAQQGNMVTTDANDGSGIGSTVAVLGAAALTGAALFELGKWGIKKIVNCIKTRSAQKQKVIDGSATVHEEGGE